LTLEKSHKEEILAAIEEAAQSVDYGEVRIKLDTSAPKLEVVIETQKKLRFEKNICNAS